MALLSPAFNDAKTYGAEWLRRVLEVDHQAGTVGAGDLKVTAAAGGGMRVDIAAGTAFVKATTGVRNGLAIAINDAAIANAVTLANAHASNPRIDLVYLRWRDTSDLGDGADDLFFDKVTGTATSGATLDNMTGVGALPANSLLLAAVLVPAASAVVSAGNVRDRRARARGAYARVVRTQNAGGTSHYGVNATTMTAIDSVNIRRRLEIGADSLLRVRLQGTLINMGTGPQVLNIEPRVNGAAVDGGYQWGVAGSPNTAPTPVDMQWDIDPTASGSVTVEPFYAMGGLYFDGTYIQAAANRQLQWTVEELLKPSESND